MSHTADGLIAHETLNTCEPNPKHSAPSPAEDGPAAGVEERRIAACPISLPNNPQYHTYPPTLNTPLTVTLEFQTLKTYKK